MNMDKAIKYSNYSTLTLERSLFLLLRYLSSENVHIIYF